MNSTPFRMFLVSALFTGSQLMAQDIHFTQFDAAPLTLNPAFTGMFNGAVRVSAIYRNQWVSATMPYNTVSVSVDAPVVTFKNGSYFAAGTQLMRDNIGDGFNSFSSIASMAFHKLFGYDSSRISLHGCDLAIGFQAGYAQYASGLNASNLYFRNDIYIDHYYLLLGNTVNYYLLNTGISFSQTTGSRFNYTIGASANNINQPKDELLKRQNELSGLDKRYTGIAGANWLVTNRVTISPSVIYITFSTREDYIAGSEFQYKLTKHPNANGNIPSIFLGGWYRTGNTGMVTAAYAFGRLRIGISRDFRSDEPNYGGGFEVMARYIAPGSKKSSHRKAIPCNRF